MSGRAFQPLKRQWEAMMEHVPPQDMAFAATYGSLLAQKRAHFLESAHPAWEIVGKWVHSMVNKDIEWLHTLKGFLESGIFFSSDLMEEVIVAKMKEASVTCISDYFHGIVDDTPSIFWLLYIKTLFLRYLAQERDVDKDSCHTEVDGLIHLVSYMTREEQDDYALSLCLMIEELDYRQLDDGDDDSDGGVVDTYAVPPGTFSNVALEVVYVLGRMSLQCASMIMRYIRIDDGDAEVATMRQRRALQALERGATSEVLHEILAPYPNGHLDNLFSGETNLTDFKEWLTCLHLLHVMIKANRRVNKATLWSMAVYMESHGQDQEEWQRLRETVPSTLYIECSPACGSSVDDLPSLILLNLFKRKTSPTDCSKPASLVLPELGRQ